MGQVDSPRWPNWEEKRTAYHGSQGPETSGELDRGVIRAGAGGLAAVNFTQVVITLNFAGLDDFFCMLITVHNFGKILLG